EFMVPGIELATKMVQEFCGGTPSNVTVAGTVPERQLIVDFPFAEVKRLTGLNLHHVEITTILKSLGFWVSGTGEVVKVAVPSWRPDVFGKADLVEEVARIAGVDTIPSMPTPGLDGVGKPILTLGQTRTRLARRALAARGMVEAVTWSFVAKGEAEAFGGGQPELELANPISSEMSDMRPSLLPGLLAAAQRNADRGQGDVALFEVGQIYRGDKPEDQVTAASGIRRNTAAIAGAGRHWAGSSATVTVFDAKADALALIDTLGVSPDNVQVAATAPAWFHPGRSGVIQLGPQNVLGAFGELHPRTLRLLDVDGPVVGFEIYLEALPKPKVRATRTKPVLAISAFQPVRRDFAFVVDKAVAAGTLLRAARGADRKLIAEVSVFDLFEGEAIGADKKSVAIEVMLQPTDKTLTDE
ncbi:MAG: phenylalanine--tRNA ligase subunit beta, partial [Hyphomicrobiales bacterium]|nr:phenylalanine--tRNA ligase subunit beta [Hyphomicrobiales bacterium]